MSSKTDNTKKFVQAIYVFCVVQFILVFILTLIFKYLDKKLLLMISAIMGIVLSSVVRRSYYKSLLDRSMKPLDERTMKEYFKDDKADANGQKN